MEKIIKNNKGVTLVILVVAVFVLMTIAGITFYAGNGIIKQANLEEIKTNMLLIEAKARECVEEANFKMGISPDGSSLDGTAVNEEKISQVRDEVYKSNGEDGAALKTISDLKAELPNVKIPSSIPQDEDTVYWVTPETMQKWGLNKITLEEKDGKIIEAYLIKFDEKNVSVEVYNNLGVKGEYSLEDIKNMEI